MCNNIKDLKKYIKFLIIIRFTRKFPLIKKYKIIYLRHIMIETGQFH